ncbi:MAG TPA: ferric reductase-like transmembrane domain-containing protein [Acidimicrobiales bacterium]|nr:ferric reductase-like transmembrane domain-containing protein [Acidimicrobiales bacterium]
MMATEGTPAFVWYLMRGSGLVALVLLSVTLALGVVGVKRWGSTHWPRIVTAGLHRNVSLLAVCFLAVHVLTAVLDNWIGLRWFGLIVPFQSTYRPIWVGMGAVALDLLIAVMATSLLRKHIGRRTWRLVHWSTWALWPVAVAHALGSGTDIGSGWALGIVVTCVAAVLGAMVWRVRPRAPRTAQAPTSSASSARVPLSPTGSSSSLR